MAEDVTNNRPLMPQSSRILEEEWLKEIKEKRILHRWLLGVSLAFVIAGTSIIVSALFIGGSILSIKTVGGLFSDIIGGTIILFWKDSRADSTDRWKRLSRVYEYDRLIDGINSMLGQMKNNKERDKFIVEKGGELFGALIDLIKQQNE